MNKSSVKKLTNVNSKPAQDSPLTNHKDLPFTLCFREKLENDYSFKKLKQSDIQKLHKFLDKVSGKSISTVDKLYLRQPDKNDKVKVTGFEGKQIQHYRVDSEFRIHGYYDGPLFIVCRLDPNHKFHD